jgi:hypothetical protein
MSAQSIQSADPAELILGGYVFDTDPDGRMSVNFASVQNRESVHTKLAHYEQKYKAEGSYPLYSPLWTTSFVCRLAGHLKERRGELKGKVVKFHAVIKEDGNGYRIVADKIESIT